MKKWMELPQELRNGVLDLWNCWLHDNGTCSKCKRQYDDATYYTLTTEQRDALAAATLQLSYPDIETEMRRIAALPCCSATVFRGERILCLAIDVKDFELWWRTVDRAVFHPDKLCATCIARYALLIGRA